MTPSVVAVIYATALFAFAHWIESARGTGTRIRFRPMAYALAIGFYATSWTYYGAVGSAVAEGWSYVPIYLGPILVFLLAPRFIERLIAAAKDDGASAISDFVGGRFGGSRGVAALVALLALAGGIPYLALQLLAVRASFALVTRSEGSGLTMPLVAIALAAFAMAYGTRRYHAASRSDGVLFAVAVESVAKLTALLVAGLAAIALLTAIPPERTDDVLAALGTNFTPARLDGDFVVLTMLAAAAVLCLPRQFYVIAVEASDAGGIWRARPWFVGYMLLTLLVVVPIAAAGLAVLPAGVTPDSFVLQLPLALGQPRIALIVFLGGLSAATAMALVETIALSTMVSNDLVAPLLLRGMALGDTHDIGRTMLKVRRAAIVAIMLAALAWASAIGGGRPLASIGLVAFAMMAQVAPYVVIAVMGGSRDAFAAKCGLATGFVVGGYTLALPQVAPSAWLAALATTPLDPLGLLGVTGMTPIVHGTLWSLGANLFAFLLATARRVRPAALPTLLREVVPPGATVACVGDLERAVMRFVGREAARDAFARYRPEDAIDDRAARLAERLIASVVGRPSARAFVGAALFGASLTHRDVAQLLENSGRSLRFSKELLAATIENIDPGISVVDRDLRLVAWNARYLDLFDYPPGLVRVGASVADLIRYNAERGECGPGEIEAHVAKRLGHMRRGTRHSFERVRPDGRVLKTVGGPMPSGGYVMCFTDVTTEARALAEAEAARTELEARVALRTAELSAANRALAAADADKTRFLAAATHDLLQPLHAARLFATALGREAGEAQRPLVARLDRSIQATDALLRTLLDISKLDAGGVVPEPKAVPLRALLGDLAETFEPLAAAKGLTLRIGPGDATVSTDPALLTSILQNLLSNAVRYTEQGRIVVAARARSAGARIDVIDTGPGIPIDQRARIFREFERLAEAAEGGVGLGLAIVERTARLLGAQIELDSCLGRGSRFSILLPAALTR